MRVRASRLLSYAVLAASAATCVQSRALGTETATLHFRVVSTHTKKHGAVPAIVWLEPLAGTPAHPFTRRGHYTLLQKNRMFIPHLLVIPVGSAVQFPNADPFFHNVFSLFDGKRFDLGLYEAGSSKSVTFSREGVSYIFCNIHPEMSAVVLALSTPLYAIADTNDVFALRDIPPGDYKMHLWIEGVPQSTLDGMTRVVHLSAGMDDLGDIQAPIAGVQSHANKFGDAYDPNHDSTY